MNRILRTLSYILLNSDMPYRFGLTRYILDLLFLWEILGFFKKVFLMHFSLIVFQVFNYTQACNLILMILLPNSLKIFNFSDFSIVKVGQHL